MTQSAKSAKVDIEKKISEGSIELPEEKRILLKSANVSKTNRKIISWYNDEEYLQEENPHGQIPMHYVIRSKKIENFFTFMMFDWFNPDPNQNKSYCLVLKSRQYYNEKKQHLLDKIYETIDDEGAKFYKSVCLLMIYQFMHELDQAEEERNKEKLNHEDQTEEAFSKLDSFVTKRVFEIKDPVYREKILQILVVFLTPENISELEEFKQKTLKKVRPNMELNKYFELAFMLKERKNIKFEKQFEEYIKLMAKIYGDYHETELKPHVRLLFKITERQKMHKTSEFIFQKCPYIEINSTIMTSFYEVQDFNVFNIVPFRTRYVYDLVSQNI